MVCSMNSNSEEVSLRIAESSDMSIVFAWQCHPSTRQFFRNPNVPDWKEHSRWFADRLQNHTASTLIVGTASHDIIFTVITTYRALS